MKLLSTIIIFSLFGVLTNSQTTDKIVVNVKDEKASINPSMWGIFFEDINFAADGGIYAELVKNRSFEFKSPLMGWKEIKNGTVNSGKVLIVNRGEAFDRNPRIAQITIDAPEGAFGLCNEGFRGMGVKESNTYDFSIWARVANGANIALKVELLNSKDQKIGEASLPGFTGDWKKYEASFTCSATESMAKLNILFSGKGLIEIDMASLFPRDTWKNRPGGLRRDLVQLLYDLKPGFIRFPGGCIVEGNDLENRYRWKNTVGKVEERKLIMNLWNDNFKAPRDAPDYFQSYGLGFYEYFLLCEDIGAEPLPIVNCGMGCQWKTAELCVIDKIDTYVQDMLDLIEFANGSIQTVWGKLRGEMGHPEPFNMRMLGIGNEQWDEQYIERYIIFTKILKEKHPEIMLVSSSGPSPDDKRFKYAWDVLSNLKAEIVDEHYYMPPQWFLANAGRYDSYNRKGPKVFAGEYAAHVANKGKLGLAANNWEAAISEAAFMTGLERNAEVVRLASYAPLFAHVNAWQWHPDCIYFDNLQSYGTPNYYVQKMFSTNKGTNVVTMLRNDSIVAGKDSIYGNAVIDKKTNELILKFVNISGKSRLLEISISGAKFANKKAVCQILGSESLASNNTFDNQQAIAPIQKEVKAVGTKISTIVDSKTFVVYRFPLQ